MNPKTTLPGLASEEEHKMLEAYKNFILVEDHPCIMAQSVFSQEHLDFHVYKDLGSGSSAENILQDLKSYISNYDFESNEFFSFVAVFKGKKEFSEGDFERHLWKELQYLHETDDTAWDAEVSSDPENPDFSFSLGGRGFYVIGLHPKSSRKARRAPFPTMVFNLHWQFDKMREMGVFQNVRDKIRERDTELQGNINPMVEDFGNSSEARQYSGRKVGNKWKCPFHKK